MAAVPAHGKYFSHRGFGKSGCGICEDAPQRRICAGRKAGAKVESGVDERTEVRCANCQGRLEWKADFAVRTADVHEFERRDGRCAGEFLSLAAKADFG